MYTHTIEGSDELAQFAIHHLPFYEKLHAQRLDVAAWEPTVGSGPGQPATPATTSLAASEANWPATTGLFRRAKTLVSAT